MLGSKGGWSRGRPDVLCAAVPLLLGIPDGLCRAFLLALGIHALSLLSPGGGG
jgi:hypothetical protein